MDNPWSSPWTTTTNDDDGATPAVPERPAAAAVFATSTPKFDIADPASPWADEDGFGDWSVPERQDAGYSNGGFASERVEQETETNGAAVRENGVVGFGDRGTDDFGIPEDGWAAPTILDDVRSPSPDPWATVTSPTNDREPRPISPKREDDGEPLQDSTSLGRETNDVPASKEESPRVSRADEAIDDVDHERHEQSPHPQSGGSEVDTNSESADSLTVKKHRRTESTASHTNGVRQASKVQELVHLYDGIAKATTVAERPAPTGEPKRIHSKGHINTAEDSDWSAEEGEMDVTVLEHEAGPTPVSPPSPLSPVSTESPASTIPAVPTSSRPPRPRHVPFEVDMSRIGHLFDGLADVIIPQPAELFDRFEDAFASISERKAWYRMSRQGSSRRHNYGDDENYTRVGWHGSAVNQQTLQIVRRWMEEDSMLGRPGHGARLGGKTAATFGWDHSSSSDPVDLSLLKRRKPSVEIPSRARTSFAPPPPHLSEARTSYEGSLNGGFGAGRGSTEVAGFSSHQRAASKPVVSSISVPVASPTGPVSPHGVANMTADGDSDEEWGDMVSSPVGGTNGFGATFADSPVSTKAPETLQQQANHPPPPNPTQPQPVSHQTLNPTSPLFHISTPTPPQKAPTIPPTAKPYPEPTRTQPVPVPSAKSPPLPNISSNHARKESISKDEDDEDEVVQRIVSGLPDLSYMLR